MTEQGRSQVQIGILGGTGNEGQGLALRWGRRGAEILLGSRDPHKAERIARELNDVLGAPRVVGSSNHHVAERAESIVSTLPHSGHRQTLASLREELDGKLVLIATVIWPPGFLERPSAAEEAQEILKEASPVVAAFQTVSAVRLRDLDREMEEDVLVCGDDPHARRRAIHLIRAAGLRGVEAGSLRQSRAVEAMTGVLLQVNKLHRTKTAGLRITGLE